MPADKNWIYDPLRNPHHNCPAHHQFEVNLVSWRLAIYEIELTYDDTQNVVIIDGHTLPLKQTPLYTPLFPKNLPPTLVLRYFLSLCPCSTCTKPT